MFMDKAFVSKYPQCTVLLQTLAGSLRAHPTVLNAFLQACLADIQRGNPTDTERIARRALTWATPPEVVVVEGLLRVPIAGTAGHVACGFHNTFLGANHLEVTDIWFDGFEFGSRVDRDRNAHRLTTTVLHEAVHWVRQQANAADEVTGLGFGVEEAGAAFERLAFGVMNCTEDEISDAILSRRV